MTLTQKCKDELLRSAHKRISGPGGRLKIVGVKIAINRGIRSVNKSEYSMNIVDYVNKYHPRQANKLSLAPNCAQKATVGELIAFYKKVKSQF